MRNNTYISDASDVLKQKINQTITLVISEIINSINDCLAKLLKSCIDKADYMESMIDKAFVEWKDFGNSNIYNNEYTKAIKS